MRTRIASAISVAVVALVVTTALFNGAPGADATQGQAVIAGQTNTETTRTNILHTAGSPTGCDDTSGNVALVGCGANTGLIGRGGSGVGVDGHSDNMGVRGIGGNYGVYGSGPIGVYGTGPTGVSGSGSQRGLYGASSGTGYGVEGTQVEDGIAIYGHVNSQHGTAVWGENEEGTGHGVVGSAAFGVGVLARSADATALAVEGRAWFSSSGRAVVAGTSASPKSFVVVSKVALTDKSMVLVTPQKAVAGVFVIGAVPNVADGKVRIVLNKAVTASYPVGWFLIEHP